MRLAQSQYRKHFVLKGTILLSKYIELGRETNDLDFLARKLSNGVEELRNIFEEIASIDPKDGFTFQEIKVSELAHPHMGYPGAAVTMIAYFVKTRFKVAIDIGFGDIVNPIEYSIPLTTSSKGALFESSVKLSCYPKEFILEGIIRSVFEHRETILALPITYEEDEMSSVQNFWREYLKNFRAENLDKLPINIAQVIAKINDWLRINTSHYPTMRNVKNRLKAFS